MRANKKYSILIILIACAIIISCFLFVNSNNKIAYADSITGIEIYQGKYDSYTDDDYFSYNGFSYSILSYTSLLYKSTSNITKNNGINSLTVTNDDPIVNIIPKELFTVSGDYIYIGKEYGFFVNTTEDKYYCEDENNNWIINTSSNNKHSFVMVFNIISNTDLSQNAGVMEFSISPIFQYEYVYINSIENQFTIAEMAGYDYAHYKTRVNYNITNNNGFVIPAARVNNSNNPFYQEEERYYLKDICYSMSLLNEQELNEGNGTLYNSNNDIGSYFTYFDYRYDGLTRKNGEFPVNETINLAEDVVDIALGLVKVFVPVASNVINGIETGILIGDTTYASLQFVTGIINYVNDSNISINNGLISTTNYYANRDDQIQYYGQLMKNAGIVVSTDDNSSIWYTKGDSNTGYFQVGHSALNGQEPYYTRLQREIGLVVVDTEGYSKAQCSNYDIMLRDPNYKTVTIDEEEQINLLPNGVNYFEFDPIYTSNYLLKFNTTDTLGIYLNGNLLSGSDNQYNIVLVAGSENSIEVRKNGTGCITTFTISPNSNLTNININSNESYIVKYVVSEIDKGIKSLSNSDSNIVISRILKLENTFYVDYTSFYEDTTLSIPFEANTYYLLINNISNENKTNTINVSNSISELALDGSTVLSFNKNKRFVKFQSNEQGTKRFAFKFDTSVYKSITLLSSELNPIIPDFILTSSMEVALRYGEILYLGINKSSNYENNDFVNVTITAKKSENAYNWEIGSISYNTNIIEVKRGSTNLEIKLFLYNEQLPIDDWYIINNIDYPSIHLAILNNKSFIDIGFDSNMGGIGYPIDPMYNGNKYFPTLYIIPVFGEIEFNIYNNTDIGFNWYHQKYINAITFETYSIRLLFFRVREISRTFSVASQTPGTLNTISIFSENLDNPYDYVYIKLTKVNITKTDGTTEDISISSEKGINLRACGGNGTSSDPYQLANPIHVSKIGSNNDKEFRLINNISLAVYSDWRSIYEFKGVLDGNNYIISNINLYINLGVIFDDQSYGFISYNYGTIKNLTFENINYSGSVQNMGAWINLGGVVGVNYANGIIRNVHASGSIVSLRSFSRVGGIAGYNYGVMENCFFGNYDNISSVGGTGDIGGIVGHNSNRVYNCDVFNTSLYLIVDTHNRSIGGIIGIMDGGTIQYCDLLDSTITFFGYANIDASTLRPCIGYIVGNIINSNLWNVGMLNSIMEFFVTLTGNQLLNIANGPWGVYGYANNVSII